MFSILQLLCESYVLDAMRTRRSSQVSSKSDLGYKSELDYVLCPCSPVTTPRPSFANNDNIDGTGALGMSLSYSVLW